MEKKKGEVLFSPSPLVVNATPEGHGAQKAVCVAHREISSWWWQPGLGDQPPAQGEKTGPEAQPCFSSDGAGCGGSHLRAATSARCLKADGISNPPSSLLHGWEHGSRAGRVWLGMK